MLLCQAWELTWLVGSTGRMSNGALLTGSEETPKSQGRRRAQNESTKRERVEWETKIFTSLYMSTNNYDNATSIDFSKEANSQIQNLQIQNPSDEDGT